MSRDPEISQLLPMNKTASPESFTQTNGPRRLRCLLLLCIIAAPSAIQADETSDFRDAAAFFRTQRWQYAADEFQKFLDQHPNSTRVPLAHLYLGLCQNSLEQYKDARDHLQTFLKASPESRNAADARYRVGECSYYLKEYDATIQQLREYLNKHDGHQLNSWGRLLLGESLNQTKQYQEAETVLTPVIPIAQKDGIQDDAEFALAVSLQGQDKDAEAKAQFQKLLDRKAQRFEHRALARLGAIAFDARDYETASSYYDRLITDHPRKPGTPTAALQSGIAKYQLKDFDAALTRFRKIPSDSAADEYGQLWQGLTLSKLGQTDAARKVLSDAYQQVTEPSLSAELLFRRAELEMLDRKIPAAVAMFKDLADRWPESDYAASSLFNVADLQLERGQLPEAETALNRLLKADPTREDDPDVLTVRGRLLLLKGETPEAIQRLELAASDPDATNNQKLIRTYHLVRAYSKAGQHQDVIKRVQPLADDLVRQKRTDVAAMLSLAAISSLELDSNQPALDYANQFLALSTDVSNQADALTARAIASSRLGDFNVAQTDLMKLVQNHKDLPATWIAVLQSAESAWAEKNYQVAADFFDMAIRDGQSPRIQVMALSGSGWSHFRLNQLQTAKDRLNLLIADFPKQTESIEGRYLLGRILVEEEQDAEAAKQFEEVFRTLVQQQSESNQKPDEVRYLFSSGRYYAQLLGRLKEADKANAVWEQLAQLFDGSNRLDQIYEEWAVLNLQITDYDKSDEIHRLLLDRFPNSPYAGQARLSLAESQMQNGQLQPAMEEFKAIVASDQYGEREQSAALYHIADIQAAEQNWDEVTRLTTQFRNRYPQHVRSADIQLLAANADVNRQQFEAAESKLMPLRRSLKSGELGTPDWSGRVWVLLAEVALAEKRYDDVGRIAAEMQDLLPKSRWMYQMKFLQGRRWKSQAPPDFARARQYFQDVTSDEEVQGSETAARSQFLIAETYMLQQDFAEAAREYHRVHLVYSVPEWQARSLFQAARCEERLQKPGDALRSYQDLVDEFPGHELAAQASERIRELNR